MIDRSTAEIIFAAERPRLVRLCARLSGNWDAAEDLAQETLLRAWRQIDRLPEAKQVAPWLSGIARNVCLEWSRRYYREQQRLLHPMPIDVLDGKKRADLLPHDGDLEVELERAELITLLDQALGLLPAETRTVLVQKYVEESSYAEIAERLGLSENAVTVRAYRGKLAFQRILANELQPAALALGLLKRADDEWEETRIWCSFCGDHRLLGRFPKNGSTHAFELRCPVCNDGAVATRADLALPYFAELFGTAKSYKPAFSRLLTAMGHYCYQALDARVALCLVCGRATAIQLAANAQTQDRYEIQIACHSCHWATNYALESFALILPEAQQFWRTYPRLRILPTRTMEVNNTPAFLLRLRSVMSGTGLDIIALRDTCKVIGIYKVTD